MANLDRPSGLKPWGEQLRLKRYVANGTTDIFKGDLVSMKSNGKIHTVLTTTGSDNQIGVASNFNDASAGETEVWVYNHPMQQFTIQDDGDGADIAQTNVGNTAPLIITAGNTTTGLSKHELDISAASTDTDDPLSIVEIQAAPGETIADFARIIVTLNKHLLRDRKAI